ncbi:hypothetical protein BD777DRAFT_164165 [Yarrowia lipolytica]|nr:hypothetical protein BD777DRAFT_164165 [Yarrowia lipolytica]
MLSSFHTVARAGADGVAGWTEAMREVLVARPLREIMAMGMTCVQDGDSKLQFGSCIIADSHRATFSDNLNTLSHRRVKQLTRHRKAAPVRDTIKTCSMTLVDLGWSEKRVLSTSQKRKTQLTTVIRQTVRFTGVRQLLKQAGSTHLLHSEPLL